MIFHIKGLDIEYEYIFEAFTRLYESSYDKDGYTVSFDNMFIPKVEKRLIDKERIEVEYSDYYCPSSIQNRILDKLVNEPYVTLNSKTGKYVFHKLREYQRNRVRNTVVLGISPLSSFTGFSKRHPQFKQYKTFFKDIVKKEEDLDEIE